MSSPAIKMNRTDLLLVGMAYIGFIVLGIPGAMLNVAWSPYLHQTFSLPKDALSVLLTMSTIGYFVASFSSGRLIRRLGIGPLLVISSGATALGLLGYAVAPAWILVVFCALLMGSGAGIMDGGLNIYFAAHFSPRLMNWLHACFGIGATLGAFIMAKVLENGLTWNWGYLIAAILYSVMMLWFALTRSKWRGLESSAEPSSPQRRTRARDTLRLGIVWVFIVLFFLYVGVEVTPPQWASPLFNENRGVPLTEANNWVSRFWFIFTVGRLFFGLIVNRIRVTTLLRLCMSGMVIGAALLWWNPVNEVGFLGLLLLGFALAPVFPLMVTTTQDILGPDHAPNAIGFQIGGASIGIAVLPSLAGIMAERIPGATLEIVGPYVLLLSVITFVLYEISLRSHYSVKVAQPQAT